MTKNLATLLPFFFALAACNLSDPDAAKLVLEPEGLARPDMRADLDMRAQEMQVPAAPLDMGADMRADMSAALDMRDMSPACVEQDPAKACAEVSASCGMIQATRCDGSPIDCGSCPGFTFCQESSCAIPHISAPEAMAQGSMFGATLAVHDEALLVGAPRAGARVDDRNDKHEGAVAQYRVGGGAWALSSTLAAPQRAQSITAGFGASIHLGAQRALIGAPRSGAQSLQANLNHGALFLVELQQDKLTVLGSFAQDGGILGAFFPGCLGAAALPDGAGEQVIVGMPCRTENDRANVGRIAVFDTAQMSSAYEFNAANSQKDARFGSAMVFMGDYLVSSEPGSLDEYKGTLESTLQFFHRPEQQWKYAFRQKLERGLLGVDDHTTLGYRLLVLSDGSLLATAPRMRLSAAPKRYISGAFIFNFEGNQLVNTQQLVDYTAFDTYAGESAATQGDVFVLGAPRASAETGFVDLYTLETSTGEWSLATRLESPEPAPGERFGESVAISAGVLYVGAPGTQRVYMFSLRGLSAP